MPWTDSDETAFVLPIVMGLRKGMQTVRGLRKQVTEPEEFLIGIRGGRACPVNLELGGALFGDQCWRRQR
jgi:hypothetical protein